VKQLIQSAASEARHDIAAGATIPEGTEAEFSEKSEQMVAQQVS